mmetsp:Transcript_36539/g.117322  ORF Transcript_36539/g.117322 Transcript_36539/m.117322 type:complete len:389 (+) Transcript_36539:1214-2380(+)
MGPSGFPQYRRFSAPRVACRPLLTSLPVERGASDGATACRSCNSSSTHAPSAPACAAVQTTRSSDSEGADSAVASSRDNTPSWLTSRASKIALTAAVLRGSLAVLRGSCSCDMGHVGTQVFSCSRRTSTVGGLGGAYAEANAITSSSRAFAACASSAASPVACRCGTAASATAAAAAESACCSRLSSRRESIFASSCDCIATINASSFDNSASLSASSARALASSACAPACASVRLAASSFCAAAPCRCARSLAISASLLASWSARVSCLSTNSDTKSWSSALSRPAFVASNLPDLHRAAARATAADLGWTISPSARRRMDASESSISRRPSRKTSTRQSSTGLPPPSVTVVHVPLLHSKVSKPFLELLPGSVIGSFNTSMPLPSTIA